MSEAFKYTLEKTWSSMTYSDDYFRYREGHSLDAIYGLRTIGVDPMTGQRLYLTKDGQVTAYQGMSDIVYLGDRQPKVNGSISTYFMYKGFSVNIGFNVKWGGKQINFTEIGKGENFNMTYNIDSRILGKLWVNSGDKALYKRYGATATQVSDMFVQKDNVFSCTNINLSYHVPTNFTKKYLGIEKISFTANLSDIFYISTIKRERGTAYPFSRNPNFGISCTF